MCLCNNAARTAGGDAESIDWGCVSEIYLGGIHRVCVQGGGIDSNSRALQSNMHEPQASNKTETVAAELFTPLTIGRYEIPNRVTMAALTRSRAGESGNPTELHAEYYSQRAGNGLVVTEGTFPEVTTRAFPGQAGIETAEQQQGWRAVVDAVHDKGGTIFMQIMHAGRLSHASLAGGAQPEAPSAIASGTAVRDFESRKPCAVPRALETAEIPRVIEQFRAAARRAIDAGLDGVEIHGANGYLLHEFLGSESNRRTDNYGGSAENRARLLVEILHAVAEEIGADRLGVRLSPRNNIQGEIDGEDADALASYSVLLDEISALGLAYVSFLYPHKEDDFIADLRSRARSNGKTKVVFNTGFAEVTQRDDAIEQISRPNVDAVALGRMVIANPDLAHRWKHDLKLNTPDPDTFYTGGARGYTDYPFA